MPFTPPDDYWIEVPGGRYTLGLLPEEARRLAEECAKRAKQDPPALTPNEWKNVRRWLEWEELDCNVEWLTAYLLAYYPAREVELAPFAIARRPVTNGEYQTFMAETGELEPESWGYPCSMNPNEFAEGIDWVAAVRFTEWAGARLPFEAEWERAVRGHERRLFSWGNSYPPRGVYATPEGMEVEADELCADLWEEFETARAAPWNEKAIDVECRVLKACGAIRNRATVVSAVDRGPAMLARYGGGTAGALRLVRADGRKIPSRRKPLARHERALLEVREFELRVLRPALEHLGSTSVGEFHTVDIGSSQATAVWLDRGDTPAGDVRYEVARTIKGGIGVHAGGDVRAGFETDPEKAARLYNDGLYLIARSKESFRRIPRTHGVFAWGIGYRLAENDEVRARHVCGFHMAFNQRIRTFVHAFREGEKDTPICEITKELVMEQVLSAFRFYEEHADADKSPF